MIRSVFSMAVLVLLLLLHVPIAFSFSAGKINWQVLLENNRPAIYSSPLHSNAITAHKLLYDSLQLGNVGLSEQAFTYAMKGYSHLKARGMLSNNNVVTIVDFSQPSNKKRLYVIDLRASKILFNTYVAHGQNTGKEYARQFSNKSESHQSSLGFYITSGTYIGGNGFSMYLSGMENGFNNNAYQRAIVMHGADYVSDQLIKTQGYIGRSHGCPAVPLKWNKPIISTIKNGSCLFIYSNNKKYLSRSKLLNT